jgi:hypothetical protein
LQPEITDHVRHYRLKRSFIAQYYSVASRRLDQPFGSDYHLLLVQ